MKPTLGKGKTIVSAVVDDKDLNIIDNLAKKNRSTRSQIIRQMIAKETEKAEQ